MSNQGRIFELMLEPPANAVGKKCYAVGLVTEEKGGDFPQKRRYFTAKPPLYVGLCTEIEVLPDYSKNIYFRNNFNEESTIRVNGPFSQMSASNLNSSQKIGFIEVVCKPETSLQGLATRKFKSYFNRMPRDEQKVMIDNMNVTGIHDIVFGAQEPNKVGGKRRKKTRKGRRKRSKKSRRRRQ
jgi:hypothetical protein